MIKIGTANYVSLAAAREYYNGDVDSALKEGRLVIGKPLVPPEATLVHDDRGRYFLKFPEGSGATLSKGGIRLPTTRPNPSTQFGRVRVNVEDISAVAVCFVMDRQSSSADDDLDAILGYARKLEEDEEVLSKSLNLKASRWWIYTDWRAQMDGLALMCEMKHRAQMLVAARDIAEFADGFASIKPTEEYSYDGDGVSL